MKSAFSLEPKEVPHIETKHRRIITKIPHPETLDILNKLRKFETSYAVDQLPIVWDKAENHIIEDPWGNRWIDFTSTIFVANVGHGNPHVVRRIREIIDRPLLHSYFYPTKIRAQYVEKLVAMTPQYLNKVALFSTGTEASERAVSIARRYGRKFSSERKGIIGGKGNFHGKTLGALMAGGFDSAKDWIGNLDPDMIQIPFPYPWVIEKSGKSGKELFHDHIAEIEKQGMVADKIAAFFIEAYQGWGAIFYPKDYVQAMREWTREHEILLVVDEIQSGFGRTGKFFCYEHYDIEPDLVMCGKGMSSSVPLSAVLGREELVELDSAYSSTHGGNPVACAAGLGTLEALEEMDLVNEAARKEQIVFDEIARWKERFPCRIGRVLGKGLVFGIFIIKKDNPLELDISFTDSILEMAMQKGVFSIRTGCGTIKLGPPLSIPDDALVEGLQVYEECIGVLDK
jgi:4-aminobutyrate aminotransferase / (S)-3-amino-2-methylpropionate transaminase / 5-aminovalerate transaminase